MDEVNFRAGRRAAAVHRHAAVAAGTFGVMVDRWIDRRFTRPSWSSAHAPAVDELEVSDAVLAAQTLRLMWGLGEGPLPNIVQLCEAKGIRVYGLPPVADVVDAFSGWSDGNPYIFLSRSKTPERSRFDVAHELGHLILHPSYVGNDADAHHRQEEDADRFAAEFLAPASSVSERLTRHPSVDQVLAFRSTFKVSAMMTAKALLRSGRTDDAGYRRLCSALARRGFRTGEPGGMAHHERSRIFTHIFGPDAADKRTTADRIAEDLSLPVNDVHALTFSTQVHAVTANSRETRNSTAPSHRQSSTTPQLRLVKG
ncbi:ImmA/IrrE family metallo-endopeptidase [uncultured Corynebacterium sp.]|uniref:ImmA/IrrE family metallo-endopeptidase n=1 Tax=uncultured Corynebacterium sp. TaxID=159447 RepID=UPI0025FE0C8E|nr:ImmA/IrrE family metallo-endopeptidase [uncultured Corynebacterium sp.]